MNGDDFSRLGRDIKEGIQDAMNNAWGDMDFSKLNETISGTIDKAVHEVADNISDAFGYKSGSKRKSNWDSSGKEIIPYNSMPKVSGILMTALGGTFGFSFGVPALVLLAIGLAAHSTLMLSLSLAAFLPLSAVSLWFMSKGINHLSRRKRFDIYRRCIGEKTMCAIRSLGMAVGKTEKYVCRDLESLIAGGYIEEGHFDEEKKCIMLTDETYQMYLNSMEQVRRAKAADEQAGSVNEENRRLAEALNTGMGYIRQLKELNAQLPDPVITAKLEHMEQVIGLIYVKIQKTPEKLASMKRFTEYYLPTTIRLVETYRELDKSQLQTENVIQSRKQIENTLDTINTAFDKLLDSFYEDDRINIQTDIKVMQTLLAQEGLLDDELHKMMGT